MFRDESWPHEDAKTLGMTNVTFVPSTGEILDADIELNAFDTQFTTSNDFVLVDLQSVLTHEVGHFLGLAHSAVKGSTMNADYDAGDLDFRSLSEDDRDAICAAYPPLDIAIDTQAEQDGASQVIDCRGADPRYGYSKYCGEVALADGCAVSAQGGTNPAGTLKSLALLSLLLVARRKTPRSE
jgi:hypothetical protein